MSRERGGLERGDWLVWISSCWNLKKGPSNEAVRRQEPRPVLIADQNYRCNVCIEEITKGDYMVMCGCEQVFHVDCSKTVEICPKCGESIRTLSYEALYTCPKCAKPIPRDDWIWLCSCEVKYHLACAKRVDSCIKCQRGMDWADGKRIKVIPGTKTVLQLKGSECSHCGKEIASRNDEYECICGTTYHVGCIEPLGTCPECNGPVVLEGEGVFQKTRNDNSM